MNTAGTDRKTVSGVIFSFLSAFLWATVYVAVRWLMGGEKTKIDPVTLSLMRFSLGGAILFLVCVLKDPKGMFSFSRRDYLRIALLGQFSSMIMSVFLFWGQCYTSAINASMIMAFSPVLTLLLSAVFIERIGLFQWGGMLISGIGCMMVIKVITPQGIEVTAFGIGDLLAFIAALSWAIAAIYAKRIVTTGNDMAVTAWSMLFASVSLLVIDVCMGSARVLPSDGTTWSLVLYLAVFPTAFGFYAWNAALSRISINIVTIMQYLTPIMTVILAFLFLGEHLTPFKILGIFLVLGGIFFSRKARAPLPAETVT